MNTLICSVPVETPGAKLRRKRSEGSLGIMPKVAIVSLVDAMKKAGFPSSSYDFYDIDMLYPSDDEIRKYFTSEKPDVVGLSAVVSTSYSQVKRISSIIRSIIPNSWIVMGGNLSESTIAPNSKLLVLIMDSVAIALVIPDDGNPLIIIPSSILILLISLISISFFMHIDPIHRLKNFLDRMKKALNDSQLKKS